MDKIRVWGAVATTEVDKNGNQIIPACLKAIAENTELPILILDEFLPEAKVGIVDKLWTLEENGITKLMAEMILSDRVKAAVVPCYTIDWDDIERLPDGTKVISSARITQFGLTAMPADSNCYLKVYNGESSMDSISVA